MLHNKAAPPILELDELPLPDYRELHQASYARFLNYGFTRRKSAAVVTSRGCPYACTYCHELFGKTWRARSAAHVLGELQSLHDQHGVEDIIILDDTFNLDRARVLAIFRGIVERKLRLRIYLANGIRADLVDAEMLDCMVQAGVIWVTYPIESAVPRLLQMAKKNLDLGLAAQAIDATCQRGIMVNVCFMVGFPSETENEAEQTLRFVQQFERIVLPMFFSVKYYPGTQLRAVASRMGMSEAQLDLTVSQSFHEAANYQTPWLPRDAMRRLFFRYLHQVFLNKNRLDAALSVQRRFLTEGEICDMYAALLRRRISDIDSEVLRLASA